MQRRALWIVGILCGFGLSASADEVLRIAPFQADITPPLGSPLCDGLVMPAAEIVDPLSARGIVLIGTDKPVVLCALDWVGIGNGGHRAWRQALAAAAGTDESHVAVHALHQHDAPGCDFDCEELVAAHGLGGIEFNVVFAREAMARTAEAVRAAAAHPLEITHVGLGRARVDRVASNRRVLGPDGKVKFIRWSATKEPGAIQADEGTIDPDVQLVSFWQGDRPLISMTYYATHPQSYYGKGGVSADFPGLARAMREAALPDVKHIHFNGAGGNVTAGKYNDGAPERRKELASRLAAGMQAAWESLEKQPITAQDVAWRTTSVALPPSRTLNEAALLAQIDDASQNPVERIRAARNLTWLKRCQANDKIELSCLHLGSARLVHMPGELFIEYQLAARAMRPQSAVCMAAYGDYGMGYIGTEISYSQGGYETGPVSRVAPQVEGVLLEGLKELLK